ncbi:hypothetical protein M422DRAFT_244028 [Sphaerobolus stellatus SS14]|nr:hypothetical protein M422DRAFT_244028 [Sphaerobolus stellatus SS14]
MDEGEQALRIRLKLNPPLKPSDNLRVIVKRPISEESQKPQKPQAPSKSQTEFLWSYTFPILLFPKDGLRITVEIFKPKKLKLLSAPPIPSTLTFKYESLLQGDGVQEIEDKGTLIVERRPGTKLTLDSLARFEASSGAKALTKGLSQLHTLFKFIAENSEILDGIIAFTTATAQIHSVAQAAALLITLPYTLLKNAHEFRESLNGLQHQMHEIFPALENINDLVKDTLLCNRLADVVKIIIQVVQFIGRCSKNGNIGMIIRASTHLWKALTILYFKFTAAKKALFDTLAVYNASNIEKLLSSDSLKALLPFGYRERVLPSICLEGTRQALLASVEDWLTNADEPNILYISGNPGAGKSALAFTIVQKLIPKRCVHFFFKRNEDPTIPWRILAYNLARINHHVARYLFNYLTADPNYLQNSSFLDHISLIIDALQTMPKTEPSRLPVIVIDALDECPTIGNNTQRQFIDSLLRWKSLPGIFKMIITSRPEGDIISKLEPHSRRLMIHSGPQVDLASTQDIKVFLTESFRKIDFESGTGVTVQDIDLFGDYAAGLFIWATTAVSYISRNRYPMERFEEIKEAITKGELLKDPEQTMESLYGQILFSIFKDLNSKERTAYQIILGTLLCYKTPLCLKDLAELLSFTKEITPGRVKNAIYDFQSLLEDPGEDKPLQFNHKSFYDLFEGGPDRSLKAIEQYRSRSGSQNELCRVDINEELARFCLAMFRMMNSRLCFNIAHVPSSYLFNKNLAILSIPDKRRLSVALIYSCQCWATHLTDVKLVLPLKTQVLEEAKIFFEKKLLYWLEAMSLESLIGNASGLLTSASLKFKDIGELALESVSQDASQFITHFYDAISCSIPHIYLSALAFAPPSQVFGNYSCRFSIPRVLHGQLKGWSQRWQILRGHDDIVTSVVYSPDGKFILSGSRDHTLRLWNASTGQSVGEPLRGHTDRIFSVAYSPDGKHIISGSSDKPIHIWNGSTRQPVGEPWLLDKSVFSVKYSPDGKYIISGSADNTIHIWNANARYPEGEPLKGHDDWVTSVAYSSSGTVKLCAELRLRYVGDNGTNCIWNVGTRQLVGTPFKDEIYIFTSVECSPDEQYIVSASSDYNICTWNISTRQLVGEPLRGHKDNISSIAYSPDGKYIVSGSDDNTIHIWNASARQPIGEPLKGHDHWINSVSYSPDGKYILSGSYDHTIHIWNADSEGPVGESSQGDIQWIVSVAYSPDGKHIVSSIDSIIQIWNASTGIYIVSGSWDNTIRIWNANTGMPMRDPLIVSHHWILSVAYSPDGKHIVSCSTDMIYIWNSLTGQLIGEPLKEHNSEVNAMTYSPNGKYIASASDDKTIQIWNASNGEPVIGPLKGHDKAVTSVAYSPDGKYIVSASDDMTICIWDVSTGDSVENPL